MDRNENVALKLGLKWWEYTKDGEGYDFNFTTPAGIIELLRLMRKRDDWNDFYKWASDHYQILDYNSSGTVFIRLSCLLDDTGKLLDAAYEWLKGKEDKP